MHAKMNALVCTGSPLAALSSSKLKSFRAINELGYVCWSAPRLLTTSSAEYGRLMPLYRGDAHQSRTACTCSSKSASSAWPAFEASARSWNESPGSADDTGGSTGLSVALDMRHAVVESGRRSRVVRFATLRDRLSRATERDTVRSIVCVSYNKALSSKPLPDLVEGLKRFVDNRQRKSIRSSGRSATMLATGVFLFFHPMSLVVSILSRKKSVCSSLREQVSYLVTDVRRQCRGIPSLAA
jgi:hypothetical protein